MDPRQPWLCVQCFAREPDLVGGDPPLRYGYALKEALRLTSDCAGLIFGGGFLTQLAIALGFVAARHVVPSSEQRVLVSVLAQLLSMYFCTLMIVGAVDVRSKRKRPVGQVYREALRRYPAVLAATLWSGLIIVVSLVALVIPGVVAATRYAVVIPVAVLEPNCRNVLRRSSGLTEGYRLRTFAVLATQAGTMVLLLGSASVIAPLVKHHALSPAWSYGNVVVQWFVLALCALLTLTTYTGLLAAEREQGRAERAALAARPD